jgi:hypothetical protein
MKKTKTKKHKGKLSMTDSTEQGSGKPSEAVAEAAAKPNEAAEGGEQSRLKQLARPRVQSALRLVKDHPLGAVATVAAAAAFIEVEFAVGILAGLGATALLASKSGPEARQQVLTRGKRALERARVALSKGGASDTAAQSAAPPS